MSHDDFKKDFFDSRNSSYNEIFSSDRKLNYDKDINIDEKNITIDVSDKNIWKNFKQKIILNTYILFI